MKKFLALLSAVAVILGLVGLATPANALVTGPVLSTISPTTGPETGGTTVTITGTNFTGATSVRFDTDLAASFTVDSDTQITAVTSAHVAGPVDLSVTTAVDTGIAAGAFEFTAAVVPTVPNAPSGLTATAGDGKVDLSWTAPSNGGSPITDYEIAYSTDNGDSYTPWVSTGTGTTATITGLTNGQPYMFKVRAVNAQGPGPESGTATATPNAPVAPTAPTAPLNLVATPGDGQITLTWNAPASDGGSAIINYNVFYSDGTGNSQITTGGVAYTYTITGLTNGTQYDLKVAAGNNVNWGPWSGTVQATPTAAPAPTVPGAPVLSGTAGDKQITLSWTTPANGGSPITGYKISYGAGAPVSVSASTNSYTITGLANGTAYTVYMWADNNVGSSVYSNSVTVTPSAGNNGGGNNSGTPAQEPPAIGTVAWDPSGGTCEFPSSTALVGSTVSAPVCTREGFEFAGWSGHGNTVMVASTPQKIPALWVKKPGKLTVTDVTVLPESVKFTYAYDDTAPVDAFVIVDTNGALVCSSTQHENTCTAADPKPSGVMYAYALNGKVEGPREKFTVRNITVTCARDDRVTILCKGDTVGLKSLELLNVSFHYAGETSDTRASSHPVVNSGKFIWAKTTGKKLYVSFRSTDGKVQSNPVVVPADPAE